MCCERAFGNFASAHSRRRECCRQVFSLHWLCGRRSEGRAKFRDCFLATVAGGSFVEVIVLPVTFCSRASAVVTDEIVIAVETINQEIQIGPHSGGFFGRDQLVTRKERFDSAVLLRREM